MKHWANGRISFPFKTWERWTFFNVWLENRLRYTIRFFLESLVSRFQPALGGQGETKVKFSLVKKILLLISKPRKMMENYATRNSTIHIQTQKTLGNLPTFLNQQFPVVCCRVLHLKLHRTNVNLSSSPYSWCGHLHAEAVIGVMAGFLVWSHP